ncbi:MAG: tryptophan synthase subunit alpha [Actinomycetota bacterium]
MGLFKRDERIPEFAVTIDQGHAGVKRSISDAFDAGKQQHRALLMPFLVCGYPDPDLFIECVRAAGVSGADILEIGIPFSDPVMDGPVIAAASTKVLQRKQTMDDAFGLLARASTEFGRPILAMTYYNMLLRRGLPKFATDCANAGVAGVIVPDLTVEESLQWSVACEQAGIASVFLASSTSSADRLLRIGQASEGFVYAAATLGVTGVRETLPPGAKELVARIRTATSKPVAVGIGVSTAAQAAEVASFADGVIVGSAVVRAIDSALEDPAPAVARLIADLRSGLSRA